VDRRGFLAAAAAAGVGIGGGFACSDPESGRRAADGSGPVEVTAFHASRRFATTSFGRIAYVERGAGAAALFLHGLPLNGYQWRGALERLSSVRRCIAPDFMGLGYSEIPEGGSLAPETQTRMLAAFLDTLGVSTVDLVACDSGGAVAQLFVVTYPERVRTLLLTNCDVHEDSPPPALLPVIAASRAGTFADDVLVPQLTDRARTLAPDGLAGCCYTYPAKVTSETIACYLEPLVSTPLRKAQLHGYCVALERNPLVAIEPALKRCEAPVRVVWGTGDTIFNPSGADWLHKTFPHSRGVRRIEGANLFFQEEMPEIIAEEARRLWLET
jgi:pimeloyl-ACP methyl ester carboxylesterase